MAQSQNEQRKLDKYFDHYSKLYPTSNQKIVQGICAFVIYFSVLGLSWSLPFPYLHFLGQYNNYFNWASFVIAFSIYYYSTLSPLLSYLMLFLALIFTYLISLLQAHYFDNGLFLVKLYFLILIFCGLIRYITYKIIGKSNTLKMELLFILIGPVWLFSFLFEKWHIKY